ncbi:MAG: FMN-binding protein [Lachnospiraceae bacterium]
MTISLILAWMTVLLAVVTSFKYIARISKSAKANHFFHNIHIPAGVVMVLVGLAHGLLAGNFAGTRLPDARIGTVLFSFNWGTACFLVSIMLGLSYLFRRVLKKRWMGLHRVLTVCLLVLIVVHILDVGIQLPSRIFGGQKDVAKDEENVEKEKQDSVVFSGAQLKDGVYEGSAQGYKDVIKVSVKVENGAVTDIQILEENDTPDFFAHAEGIIEDIMNEQSLDVDVVSGATYSSAGILNAVNDALESAVVDGELESNEIELPSRPSHKHGGPGEKRDSFDENSNFL